MQGARCAWRRWLRSSEVDEVPGAGQLFGRLTAYTGLLRHALVKLQVAARMQCVLRGGRGAGEARAYRRGDLELLPLGKELALTKDR